MLYADQKTYLVELLMKQDQMSMACSIESRVPFLDHPFVEFASRIPDRLKIRGGVGKYVFKKAVEDLLPRGSSHRKKMGFPTPLRQWLRDPAHEPLFRFLLVRDGLLAAYHRPAIGAFDRAPSRRSRRCHGPHLAPVESADLGRSFLTGRRGLDDRSGSGGAVKSSGSNPIFSIRRAAAARSARWKC